MAKIPFEIFPVHKIHIEQPSFEKLLSLILYIYHITHNNLFNLNI